MEFSPLNFKMGPGEKLVRDVKRSAQYQEEIREDIVIVANQLTIEGQNLSMLQKEGKSLEIQLTAVQQSIESLENQEKFLSFVREANNKTHLFRLHYKKFIENMDPDNDQKAKSFEDMQNRYRTLIERYEQKPEYRQIVDAEAAGRKLSQVIAEKRKELMKLETEREF